MKRKNIPFREEGLNIPKWIRISLIIVAILALIFIMQNPNSFRKDFPVFRGK